MKTHVRQALFIIEDALGRSPRPYVAFSGGKDSLVVADLVRQVDPTVDLLYFDDELVFDEQTHYIAEAQQRYGDRLRIISSVASAHGNPPWFVPWAPGHKWWRPPLPAMEWTPRIEKLGAWLGYDGCILGMRRDESERRRAILSGATGILTTRGRRRDGSFWHLTYANPIIDWTVYDVWRYIQDRDLPYCAVYDVLTRIGVKPRLQRVGPLPLAPGEYLWKGWPDLYVRIVQRYGRRWTVPRRKPRSMDMLTWLDLQEALS